MTLTDTQAPAGYRRGSRPRPGFDNHATALQSAVIFLAEGFTSAALREGLHPQDEVLGELADAIDALTDEGFTSARARDLVGLGEIPVPLQVTPPAS